MGCGLTMRWSGDLHARTRSPGSLRPGWGRRVRSGFFRGRLLRHDTARHERSPRRIPFRPPCSAPAMSSSHPSAAPGSDGKETARVVSLPFLHFPRPSHSDFKRGEREGRGANQGMVLEWTRSAPRSPRSPRLKAWGSMTEMFPNFRVSSFYFLPVSSLPDFSPFRLCPIASFQKTDF